MMQAGGFLWIYGAPLALGVCGLLGVGFALFGDAGWDAVSWLALGAMTTGGLWPALVRTGKARANAVSDSQH